MKKIYVQPQTKWSDMEAEQALCIGSIGENNANLQYGGESTEIESARAREVGSSSLWDEE